MGIRLELGKMRRRFVLLVCLLCLAVAQVTTGTTYSKEEAVPMWANKVGPYSSPSETYSFYHLPACQPPQIQHEHETLGEVLGGDDLQSSLYDIRFRVNIQWQSLCKLHLFADEVDQLMKAVDNFYYFELVYDKDLPLWGFVGTPEMNEEGEVETYVFAHLHFSMTYNGNHVISANVTADQARAVKLIPGESQVIEYSYSASWSEIDIKYEDRMDVYNQYDFFSQELEIHWLSVMNSLILVVLLAGFLALILVRVLRRDFSRYELSALDKEAAGDDAEEYGWKLVHADVFRFPAYPSLFCSIVGNGVQFFTMIMAILMLAVVGVFYPTNRGLMQTAAVVLYALTCFIGGFVSSQLYRQMRGERWAWNIVQTSLLFAVPFFITWFILNSIAVSYESTSALPFGTIVIIALIWGLVGFPLTVVGGISGRQAGGEFDAPCRVSKVQREIPPMDWYREGWFQIIVAGFLPFSAIYIELYYIFSSVWGHRPYTLYGILLLVFVILLVVTIEIQISLTYFQLAAEDHRWWWRSLLSGGSTAVYIYGYAMFYFSHRSDLSGTLQSAFYFGYTAMACLAFFMMLGTVGWWASLVFVRRLFHGLKTD